MIQSTNRVELLFGLLLEIIPTDWLQVFNAAASHAELLAAGELQGAGHTGWRLVSERASLCQLHCVCVWRCLGEGWGERCAIT